MPNYKEVVALSHRCFTLHVQSRISFRVCGLGGWLLFLVGFPFVVFGFVFVSWFSLQEIHSNVVKDDCAPCTHGVSTRAKSNSCHLAARQLNTHVLSFHSLVVLPAELLAIPVPDTSWAFEEAPVMSLSEWEEYRRRSTSTVILTTTERNLSFFSQLAASVTGRAMPAIAGFLSMGRLLTSRLCGWQPGPVKQPSPLPVQQTMPSLCNHASWTGPTQGTEPGASSSRQSAQSSSTELRAAPPKARGALVSLLYAVTGPGWASVPTHISTPIQVHRPTVPIRGCIPKGHLVYRLSY